MRRNIIVDVLFVIVYSLLLLMFGKASANVREGGRNTLSGMECQMDMPNPVVIIMKNK